MSGMVKAPAFPIGKDWFIAVFDMAKHQVVRIIKWEDWTELPVSQRPPDATLIENARDELDAYRQAMDLHGWTTKEQTNDQD